MRERRRHERRAPRSDEPLRHMRLRAGRELAVVDVCAGGALLEGASRLMPGTHADIHVVTRQGRVLARARVLRAWISALEAEGVTYRSAVAFAEAIDTTSAAAASESPDSQD